MRNCSARSTQAGEKIANHYDYVRLMSWILQIMSLYLMLGSKTMVDSERISRYLWFSNPTLVQSICIHNAAATYRSRLETILATCNQSDI